METQNLSPPYQDAAATTVSITKLPFLPSVLVFPLSLIIFLGILLEIIIHLGQDPVTLNLFVVVDHRRASGEPLADRLAKPDAEPVLEGTCFDGRSGSFLLGRLRQNLADDLWNDLAPGIERSGRCGLVLKGLDRRNHWLDLAHGRVMSDTGSLKQVGAGDYRLTAARSHEPVGAEAAMMG